jgi:carbon monoxide dehydrogenase subunit G
VRLADLGTDRTRLDWDAEAFVAGALAGFAGRVSDAAVDDAIGGAIDCLERSLVDG